MEEDKEYNINELKFITDLENHWITIQKYLNMFNLIQKYCPKIELDGSKLRIIKSEIYRRLTEKEKLILYLVNNQALNPDTAVKLPEKIDISLISESIDYLFKKTEDNSFFLSKSGVESYRYLKKDLSDLIYNNKEIDEVFRESEENFKYETETELIEYNKLIIKEIEEPILKDIIQYFYSKTESEIPIYAQLYRTSDSTVSKLENYPLNFI